MAKWPNPPWSTFILRKLLENENFENAFVNRFSDHLNYSFTADRVNSCINYYYKMLEPEIGRHHLRWNLNSSTWEMQVKQIKNFADNRPTNIMMTVLKCVLMLQSVRVYWKICE